MLSRLSRATKRSAGSIGVPYVRVPSMHVGYRRPFASDDQRGVLSRVALPFVRLPEIQLKVFRPFH
jgi:hypothetical protein